MTKQELLTKLATECETWAGAVQLGRAEAYYAIQHTTGGNPFTITEKDWLDERERLLNNVTKALYIVEIVANYPEDGSYTLYYTGNIQDSGGKRFFGCISDFYDFAVNNLLHFEGGEEDEGIKLSTAVERVVTIRCHDCFDYNDCPRCTPKGYDSDTIFDPARGVIKRP